jgi:hypothetical protein
MISTYPIANYFNVINHEKVIMKSEKSNISNLRQIYVIRYIVRHHHRDLTTVFS